MFVKKLSTAVLFAALALSVVTACGEVKGVATPAETQTSTSIAKPKPDPTTTRATPTTTKPSTTAPITTTTVPTTEVKVHVPDPCSIISPLSAAEATGKAEFASTNATYIDVAELGGRICTYDGYKSTVKIEVYPDLDGKLWSNSLAAAKAAGLHDDFTNFDVPAYFNGTGNPTTITLKGKQLVVVIAYLNEPITMTALQKMARVAAARITK